MLTKKKLRSIFFIFIAIAALLFKKHYVGPEREIVISYLGNVSASFAVFFIVSINSSKWKDKNWITALLALLIVELFELTNGFGIMSNTFDPIDLIANLGGVLLALGLNLTITKFLINHK